MGALIGSIGASQVDDQVFERLFGALMLPLLGLSLWKPKALWKPKVGGRVIAVPVFVINGEVRWLAALVLSIGTGLGGYLGAQVAVDDKERSLSDR